MITFYSNDHPPTCMARGYRLITDAFEKYPAALVCDLTEPPRLVAGRIVLDFVQSHMFLRKNFTIRNDGVCRLNPEMAPHIAASMEVNLRSATTVSTTFLKH